MPALSNSSIKDASSHGILPASSLRVFAQVVTYAIAALALLAAALLMVHEGSDGGPAQGVKEPPSTVNPATESPAPTGLAWGA